MLEAIKVSWKRTNATIEITANKSFKYEVHNITQPPRGVIDLPLTDGSRVRTPIVINSRVVKRIDVIKRDIDGYPSTRVIIKLTKPFDLAAREDLSGANRIILSITEPRLSQAGGADGKTPVIARKAGSGTGNTPNHPPASVAGGSRPQALGPLKSGNSPGANAAAPSPSSAAAGVAVPASAASSESGKNAPDNRKPQTASAVMVIDKVNITRDGIVIPVEGLNDNFRFFKFGDPQKLVIDVFGAKTGVNAKSFSVNRFGIKSVRLGRHPDKVRLVFDPSRRVFPACRIEVDGSCMRVLFATGEKTGA